MSATGWLRSYWRVTLLAIFILASCFALFVPGGVFAGDDGAVESNESIEESRLTNLAYGLGLEGGTRISAPPVGMTAESLEIGPDEQSAVGPTVAEELGVDRADVHVRYDPQGDESTVELFTANVSESEFVSALQSAGVDAGEGDVRDGVTSETRTEMKNTVERKINEAGLSGGRVTWSSTVGGEYYMVVEVPDMGSGELRDLLSERGIVRVVAHYPGENGTQTNTTVLEQDDFANVDPAAFNDQNGDHVPVQIREETASEFQSQMNEFGFTGEGVGQCTGEESIGESGSYCLITVTGTEGEQEVVDAHSMGNNLASPMSQGTWVNDPTFVMLTPSQQEAQELSLNLRAGSLRAPLNFDDAQSYTLESAHAEQFRQYSLLIAVLAVITVSGVVYLRYADGRVAAPMVVTALSEVVILLGFAAAIEMPLDLSHVAGFIAVIGTGVDDLVIIADEVMSEGDVNSSRVFESRFRKAFWVIGAAAATTILAMSPLAVLSLGDLRGFAIVTILGVLVGVLVTRPAYGDILRMLLTDDR